MTVRVSVEDLLRYAKAIVETPSPTANEAAVARTLAELMMEFSDDIAIDDLSNVYCRIKGKEKGKTILLTSHTDTTGTPKLDEKLEAKIVKGASFGKQGDVFAGLGAAAPKGALAAMLAAGKALSQSDEHRGELIVAGYVQDFTANHIGLRTMLDEIQERGTKVDAVILAEPSDNRVVFGARGRLEMEITVRGKPTHSGRPKEGINAVEEMAHLLVALDELELPKHSHLPGATMTVIEIRSSAVRPRTPHECAALIDRRILPNEDPDEVVRTIREVVRKLKVKRPNLDAEVKALKVMYPFQTSLSDPSTSMVVGVVERVTGRKQGEYYGTFSTGSGWSKTRLGIPSVSIGPGRSEDMLNEHVEISRLVEAGNIYAESVVEIAKS